MLTGEGAEPLARGTGAAIQDRDVYSRRQSVDCSPTGNIAPAGG